MPEIYTAGQFRGYVERQYVNEDQCAHVLAQVNVWLARGDGAAVYENHDPRHPERGSCRIVSYGSPAAQIETAEPPSRLPDIGNAINWRYVLGGTYRGGCLMGDSSADPDCSQARRQRPVCIVGWAASTASYPDPGPVVREPRKTVGDLIAELQQQDPAAPVVIGGYEFGYDASDVTVLPSGAVCVNSGGECADDGSPL